MHARLRLNEIATELQIPLENVLSPDVARKIAFDSAAEKSFEFSPSLVSKVETQLRLNGAREWQIEKCALALAQSLCESEPPVSPEPPAQDAEPSSHPSGE
jgi:ribonuclease D